MPRPTRVPQLIELLEHVHRARPARFVRHPMGIFAGRRALFRVRVVPNVCEPLPPERSAAPIHTRRTSLPDGVRGHSRGAFSLSLSFLGIESYQHPIEVSPRDEVPPRVAEHTNAEITKAVDK